MKPHYILRNSEYYAALYNSILKAEKSFMASIFSFNANDDCDDHLSVRNLLKLICQKRQQGIEIKILFGNTYKSDDSKQFSNLDFSNEFAYTFLKSFDVPVAFFQHFKQESSHSKYAIVDDEIVFVGSHNFSPRAFDSGNDDSLCIHNKALAEQLKAVFLTDWNYAVKPSNTEMVDFDNSSVVFSKPLAKDLKTNSINDDSTFDLLLNKEYFETVLKEIQNATSTIDISMFYFSYAKDKNSITSKLFNALTLAHNKGVKIRFVLDRDRPTDIYASYRANIMRFNGLKKTGIDVKFDRKEIVSHTKLLIVDGEKVLIGSHNWTYGSYEKYQDVSVMIESKMLAEAYTKLFNTAYLALN